MLNFPFTHRRRGQFAGALPLDVLVLGGALDAEEVLGALLPEHDVFLLDGGVVLLPADRRDVGARQLHTKLDGLRFLDLDGAQLLDKVHDFA